MKRPLIFMSMLMLLLMFQSVWNIAAAFCEHEKIDSVAHLTHFGHHQPADYCQKDHKASEDKHDQYHDQANMQDHHDHLISFNHILVIPIQTEVTALKNILLPDIQKYFWLNLYQSPDLSGLTPPPLSTPL